MNQVCQNLTPGAIPVYADSAMSQQIGKLYSRSACRRIGEHEGLAIVLYKIRTGVSDAFKVGFVETIEEV